MAERIERAAAPGFYDDDGHWHPGGAGEPFFGDVSPLSQSEIDGADYDGDTTKLQVLAPAGTQVSEGEVLTIRGLDYVVVFVPFDWSVGRRPLASFHRTKLQIVVERSKTDG